MNPVTKSTSEENHSKDFECTVKYLGKLNAIYPKIGTLENTARLYQQACAFLRDTEHSRLYVTRNGIIIYGKEIRKDFELKRISFCASYKKIPKVVAFNYLTSTTGPKRMECHAVLCSSVEETQDVVCAVTAAFRSEPGFRKPLIGDFNNNARGSEAEETSIQRKIGAMLDSLTKCVTIER